MLILLSRSIQYSSSFSSPLSKAVLNSLVSGPLYNCAHICSTLKRYISLLCSEEQAVSAANLSLFQICHIQFEANTCSKNFFFRDIHQKNRTNVLCCAFYPESLRFVSSCIAIMSLLLDLPPSAVWCAISVIWEPSTSQSGFSPNCWEMYIL